MQGEKLELRRHSAYDARIRLLGKLYKNKKQSVVKEIENLKVNFLSEKDLPEDLVKFS